MTQAQLAGVNRFEELRLLEPVWGLDPSTKRMAAGILVPTFDVERGPKQATLRKAWAPAAAWSSRTMPASPVLAFRQIMAVDAMAAWFRELAANHGRPGAIGIEKPMGKTVPLPSYYLVGAIYCAIGEVWGGDAPLVLELAAQEWKLAATGYGYAPGLPRSMPKPEKRRIELARLVQWATDACSYGGESDDEAAGLGVAVATGHKLRRRL